MPPLIRRLLVLNDDPATASAPAVLRASNVGLEHSRAALRALSRPASEVLQRVPATLGGASCQALRAAVDEAARLWDGALWCPAHARNGKDTVDGLLDYQLNLDRHRAAAEGSNPRVPCREPRVREPLSFRRGRLPPAEGWLSVSPTSRLLRSACSNLPPLPDLEELLGPAQFDTVTRVLPWSFDVSANAGMPRPPSGSGTARLGSEPTSAVVSATEAAPAPPRAPSSPPRLAVPPPRLVVRQCFVRRYTPMTRPWFTFHTDAAALTANIALSDDDAHRGGRLLALLEGEVCCIARAEGEATIHPSTLLHGVSRMTGGVRFSLIVFYETSEAALARDADDRW